ncbi:hypothetical protein FACS1894167_00390 [Synergistales bacterium]|nr:hypothetical protein FACS1894167_00390 [Synergistales bacterium]
MVRDITKCVLLLISKAVPHKLLFTPEQGGKITYALYSGERNANKIQREKQLNRRLELNAELKKLKGELENVK